MDPVEAVKDGNGSKPLASQADINNKTARRRPAQQDASSSGPDDDVPNPGTADGPAGEDAPKKRRGPKPGTKRAKKQLAAPPQVAFDAATLPEPKNLPLDYLIECVKYLKLVEKRIQSLDDES